MQLDGHPWNAFIYTQHVSKNRINHIFDKTNIMLFSSWSKSYISWYHVYATVLQGELGANAILAVSIAACKAGAAEKEALTFSSSHFSNFT